MQYPQIYKLNYSKKYLRFFYFCCFLSLIIIWWFGSYFLAIILSFIVIIYGIFITKKVKNTTNTIVINKNNILVNDKKVIYFEVIFSSNIWSGIKYKHKGCRAKNLLIFGDSCGDIEIRQMNKYFNFGVKI
jgi:hypothetical protein